MTSPFPDKTFILRFLIVIGLLALVIHLYLPRYSRYQELQEKEQKLDQEIEEISGEIDQMKKEQDLLENDPEFLEQVVRENMGHVEPGETVYKVVNEPSKGYQILEPDEGTLAGDTKT